jgi:dTDP-glucose 4,6-dehydratase
MATKTFLVTGGSGFIGSNFIATALNTDPTIKIINVDALTYAAHPDNTKEVENNPNYTFIKADIRYNETIAPIFEEHTIDAVIHFAAESHVDNSISQPNIFIETNVTGTLNLLNCAKAQWMENNRLKPDSSHCRFIHVSTDEVFGSLGATGLFTEESPYHPNSPYSASKASSDHLVRSYFHTYAFPALITNCSNNYGPHQHKEKLIPTIIRSALNNAPIPIYGTGENVRDWLFVTDHCTAIMNALLNGVPGETYCIGGNNEVNNLEMAGQICAILDTASPRTDGQSYSAQITFVTDRLGHDFRYAINSEKIKRELGWSPTETISTGLQKTVTWYLNNPDYLK